MERALCTLEGTAFKMLKPEGGKERKREGVRGKEREREKGSGGGERM